MNQTEIDKIVAEAEAVVHEATLKLTATQATQTGADITWEKADDARIDADGQVDEADYVVEKATAKLDRIQAWSTSLVAIVDVDPAFIADCAHAAAGAAREAETTAKALKDAVAVADFTGQSFSWYQRFNATQAAISAGDLVHHTALFAKSVTKKE